MFRRGFYLLFYVTSSKRIHRVYHYVSACNLFEREILSDISPTEYWKPQKEVAF